MRILVINAGSSSLKGSVVELPGEHTLAAAESAAVGETRAQASAAAAALLDALGEPALRPDAVGHRVVHGGSASAPRRSSTTRSWRRWPTWLGSRRCTTPSRW